ncbi:hypothetical protein B6U91_00725 [Candidatus Pacearchaeota archaeon ex4484_71]|nr:MAG: hypothetical protein B6U91_00725 [Candidatus Pacearchaeota archaeon ex4484_71]
MNFIKSVIDKKENKFAHIQFQKFSKGEFKNRALIRAKKSKEKYTIYTSAEFANDLVLTMAEKLGKSRTKVVGAIVSTSDLKDDIEFKEIKQFQGVKRYLIDKEMSGGEISSLLEKFPKTFFALSFEVEGEKLKIKPKAPKSGKPGKGDSAPKADFCKLITFDKNIGGEFVFEKDDFKDAEIEHTFVIEKIEIPEHLKNSDDFAKIREESLRKGRIIRKAKIDGEIETKDYEFEA